MTAKNGANMNTVVAKRSKYSVHEYSCGVISRLLHDIIGRPGLKQFLEILDVGIPNFPLQREYAPVAEDCFGTNLHSLKGKTVHKKPKLTGTYFAPLPPHIMSKYRDITVYADLMKFDLVRLFISIFNSIFFCTA